jgi:PAS domain S-box-containing protein
MKTKLNPLPNPAELRRRAEVRQKAHCQEAEQARTEADMRRLVQELQIHQIELEMQNEELQQARNELEAGLEKYSDLYDFAPVGYFNLAAGGAILAVNLTGARLVGIERAQLLNRRFKSLVTEADQPVFDAFLQKIFTGEGLKVCKLALLKAETTPLFVHVEAVISAGRQECRAAVLDVTTRHLAEAERERLIQELEKSLAFVKLLSGLLPICSGCKKIRDEKDCWNHVEVYIGEHSEAKFTHGLCPDCAKHYGNLRKLLFGVELMVFVRFEV